MHSLAALIAIAATSILGFTVGGIFWYRWHQRHRGLPAFLEQPIHSSVAPFPFLEVKTRPSVSHSSPHVSLSAKPVHSPLEREPRKAMSLHFALPIQTRAPDSADAVIMRSIAAAGVPQSYETRTVVLLEPAQDHVESAAGIAEVLSTEVSEKRLHETTTQLVFSAPPLASYPKTEHPQSPTADSTLDVDSAASMADVLSTEVSENRLHGITTQLVSIAPPPAAHHKREHPQSPTTDSTQAGHDDSAPKEQPEVVHTQAQAAPSILSEQKDLTDPAPPTIDPSQLPAAQNTSSPPTMSSTPPTTGAPLLLPTKASLELSDPTKYEFLRQPPVAHYIARTHRQAKKRPHRRPTTHSYAAWLTNVPQPMWPAEAQDGQLHARGDSKDTFATAHLTGPESNSGETKATSSISAPLLPTREDTYNAVLGSTSLSTVPLRIPRTHDRPAAGKENDAGPHLTTPVRKSRGHSRAGITSTPKLLRADAILLPRSPVSTSSLHPLSPRNPHQQPSVSKMSSAPSVPRIVLSPPPKDERRVRLRGTSTEAKGRDLFLVSATKTPLEVSMILPCLDFNMDFDLQLSAVADVGSPTPSRRL
ncbi:hypothetical protein PLICRDRAFT_172441 [Plicaturopsis crispa FD-325 SS-3]|nr:hypothetical protein PLICRDRAFT_172441 [Plicaturopsis crispa FD-325 SS-3]